MIFSLEDIEPNFVHFVGNLALSSTYYVLIRKFHFLPTQKSESYFVQ